MVFLASLSVSEGFFLSPIIIDDDAQGFLGLEVIVERSLGDVGSGENCIDAGTLKAGSVDLSKGRLQQAFPCTLRITGLSLFLVSNQHTDLYVC
jgi:hypothetical protein